jgi:hypothetical protein
MSRQSRFHSDGCCHPRLHEFSDPDLSKITARLRYLQVSQEEIGPTRVLRRAQGSTSSRTTLNVVPREAQ